MRKDNLDIPGLDEFLEETDEILQDMEEAILLLEDQPKDRSLIDRIFRGMHTIKGGAGMVMQPEMADYAHHFENLLDKARNGEIVCTPAMATLLLDSLDGFRSFLGNINGTEEVNQNLVNQTLSRISEFEPGSKDPKEPPSEDDKSEQNLQHSSEPTDPETPQIDDEPESIEEKQAEEEGFLLRLKFNLDMLRSGGDPILLIQELEKLGQLNLIPHLGSIPDLQDLNPEDLHLWWNAKLVTTQSISAIEDLLAFYQEGHDIKVDPVNTPPPEKNGFTRSYENVIEGKGESATTDSEKNLQEKIESELKQNEENNEPTSEIKPQEKNTEKLNNDNANNITPSGSKNENNMEHKQEENTEVAKSSNEGDPENTNSEKATEKKSSKDKDAQLVQSIRVAVERLDKLQNLVGETVINQSRLQRLSEQIMGVDENLGEVLLQFVEDNGQSIRELQDLILQVRMIPVGSIFTPMKRTVRDFANRSGKKIRLEIEGGDTELDKTVTEQLHGPLVHLVRNSMDHGIEDSETRQRNEKDPTGRILLKATHQEGYVIVEIEDDGKGIDPQAVFESALRKELVNASDVLSEEEIFGLLFLPGFTTTTQVTDVSGRGVGMDTVKRDIEALLGTIEMSSVLGKGTNVKLKLPLTLAIIEGMMVNIGKEVFTLPLLSVIEALRPLPKQVKKIKGEGELVEIRGEYIPLLRLHERLELEPRSTDPTECLVIVVQHANRKQCMLVDEIVDQGPVVIKSMEDNFIQVSGLSGATILGDGSVSFILDVPSLVN